MTAYEDALARSEGNVSGCDDAALMAGFLDGSVQILLGAVSPKLLWQGAQRKGLTTQELTRLIHSDPVAASELMWAE